MTAYRQPTRPDPSSLRIREDPDLYRARSSSERDADEERWEEFLRYLRTVASEPKSTLARQLISDGIALPPPESFTEVTVRKLLREVITGLAQRRHFLYHTNHLSDLELYRHLWEITLNAPNHELDVGMDDCACHIDLVSDGSEEAIWLWLRYYANEDTRADWAADFPGDRIPGRCAPSHDRDRHLPAPLES